MHHAVHLLGQAIEEGHEFRKAGMIVGTISKKVVREFIILNKSFNHKVMADYRFISWRL